MVGRQGGLILRGGLIPKVGDIHTVATVAWAYNSIPYVQ